MRKCERCNHSWFPRMNAKPKFCPKCKSPYWNKKRIRDNSSSAYSASKQKEND